MAGRWLLFSIALALVGGAVAWALTGLPGGPAACLPAGCDCEGPGPGPIRQPANAWSSLALAAAGVFVFVVSPGFAGGDAPGGRRGGKPQPGRPGEGNPAGRPGGLDLTRRITGGALVGAGMASFLYHAGLTGWATRLDGIAVVALIGAAALHGWARRPRFPRGRPRQPSPPASPRARLVIAVIPWLLLALGGAAWWLGGSGGPWCRPESPLPAHAVWHLSVAAAAVLWLCPRRRPAQNPCASPPGL